MGSQTIFDHNNCVLEWSDERILNNIKYVVSQVMLALESEDEHTGLEYILFSLKNVVHHIPLNKVEELLLERVCCMAEKVFINTILGIENLGNGNAGLSQTQINTKEACVHLLTICCTIMDSLQETGQYFYTQSNVKCIYVKSLLSTVTKISHVALPFVVKYQNKRNNIWVDSLTEFQHKLSVLLRNNLQLIAKNIELRLSCNEDVNTLSEVVETAQLTLCTIEADVLVMVESWKNYIVIVEKYQECLKENLNIAEVVRYLCNKILKCKAFSASHCEFKEMINSLKVSNFLLKIVVKLCRMFGCCLGKGYCDVAKLLLVLYRSTPSYLKSIGNSPEMISEITKHLVIGADPLLLAVYFEFDFQNILKDEVIGSLNENPYGCIILLVFLLKKITSTTARLSYFGPEMNILDLVFISFGTCHEGLVEEKFTSPGSLVQGQSQREVDLYEYVFTTTAVFVLSLSADEFSLAENTLLGNVLQTDPWRAILATDLWCLVARYANAEVCHSTLNALIPVFQKVDLNSCRPEFVYLSWLVSRLLPLSEPEYIKYLYDSYPPKNNPSVWHILGLTDEEDRNVEDTIDSYLEVVRNWTESCDESPDNFLRMEFSVLALSSITSQDKKVETIQDVIKELWAIEPSSSRWVAPYFCAISNFSTAYVSTMTPDTIIIMLRQINQYLKLPLTLYQQLKILQILEKLSISFPLKQAKDEIIERLAVALRAILTSESPIMQVVAAKAFSNLAHITQNSNVIEYTVATEPMLQKKIVDFLQKKLPPNNFVVNARNATNYCHYCPKEEERETDVMGLYVNPKRFKADSGTASYDALNVILQRFEGDSSVIFDNLAMLNEKQRNLVRLVCKKLNII